MGVLYRMMDALRHKARLRQWRADHAWGRRGEDLAHRYLEKQGFCVIARNYRTTSGSAEADIVAWDGASLVFVEVKSRANVEFGAPELAVDREKRTHILRAASEYIRHAEVPETCVRFDIVSVVFSETLAIRHIRDAFYWPRKAA